MKTVRVPCIALRRLASRSLLAAVAVALAVAGASASAQAAPVNDNFADATPLSGFPTSAQGGNLDATEEPGEPDHAGSSGGRSVWWTWTAPMSAEVRIDTCHSDFDTVLAVYTGDAVDNLGVVASNDDACGLGSIVAFEASEGTSYRIAVDGYGQSSGNVALTIAEPPPPPLPTHRYLALGDSVTMGTGAPFGSGFVDLYYAYLRDPAHGGVDELVNLAASGETSSSMRNGWQLDEAIAAIDDRSDTRVVTLGIGANDGLSGACPSGYGTDPCPFRANYTAIVDSLRAALNGDPGDEVFQVMQYYNPASGTGSSTESAFDFGLLGEDGRVDCAADGARLGLNDLVGCIGREHGVAPVDLYPTFKQGGQSLIADGIHPNATGHAYIACLFEHPERAGSPSPCQARPPRPDLEISLTGRARQRVLKQRGVVLYVSSNEDADVTASGTIKIPGAGNRPRSSARAQKLVRMTTVAKSVAPGSRTKVKLRLSKKGRRLVRRALKTRRALSATVTVTGEDAAGSSDAASRRIRLVR